MRSNALRLVQSLGAGVLREAARASSGAPTGLTAARFLSALANASMSGPAILSMRQQQQALAPALSLAVTQALGRSLHATSSLSAEALAEVALEGDGEGVLRELDSIVSSESATAKEVADAAVALAYLQIKGNRRIWGKVVEKAGALKGSFDAASLTSLLWALTTAGVEHFKTVAELSGAAAAQLKTLSPTQLSVVVEALGKAGVQDLELFGKISDTVSSNPAGFKPAELARILWGYAAAGVNDGKLVKAVGKALTDKPAELGAREAAQGLWALAALGRVDKPTIDGLTKALKSKLSSAESAVDAAAAAWALGQLGIKDAATGKALGDALTAGAGELSATQAIQAALGLGQLGATDAVASLFGVAAAAIEKAPASLDMAVLAQLHAAAAYAPAAPLPPAVAAYAAKAFGLAADAERAGRSGYAQCFAEDLADAVALATGARYRPEAAAAKKGFGRAAPDGSLVEVVMEGDVAVIGVPAKHLSSTSPATVLGSAAALAKVREAQGFKVVLVTEAEWSGLKDAKAKAGAVLAAVRKAVPGAASKVDALSKKLAEPFDPYAK